MMHILTFIEKIRTAGLYEINTDTLPDSLELITLQNYKKLVPYLQLSKKSDL